MIGDKIVNTKELDEMLEDMLPDHTVPEKDRFLKLSVQKENTVNEFSETYASLAFLSLYPLGLEI